MDVDGNNQSRKSFKLLSIYESFFAFHFIFMLCMFGLTCKIFKILVVSEECYV
jgi:hypothetical protein